MGAGPDWYPAWNATPRWYSILDLVPHPLSGTPSTVWYPTYYLVSHPLFGTTSMSGIRSMSGTPTMSGTPSQRGVPPGYELCPNLVPAPVWFHPLAPNLAPTSIPSEPILSLPLSPGPSLLIWPMLTPDLTLPSAPPIWPHPYPNLAPGSIWPDPLHPPAGMIGLMFISISPWVGSISPHMLPAMQK